MSIVQIKDLLLWCTIINGAMLLMATVVYMALPDFVYRLQTRMFPMNRETFTVVFYSAIGIFKIFFLIFNLTPFIALTIMGF